MKVYALFHDWVDLYAYNEYGADPFHKDLIGLFSSKESAEKEALNRGMIINPRRYANENGEFAVIEEIEVKE